MKIKSDFVTNSSSASFIIHFKSKDGKIDDNFLTDISAMENDEKIKFLNSIKRQEDGTFIVTSDTSMFNFWDSDSLDAFAIRLYMYLTLETDNSNYELISAELKHDR